MDIREQFLKMKEEAKKLEEKFGWITIPVFLYKKEKNKYNKAPLIQWKEVVNEPFEVRWGDYIIPIAEKKAKVYEGKDPNIGIAVITGKPSQLTVIDFDDPTQYFTIKNEIDTIKQETRRGGHLFFKYDPEIKTQVNKKLNMDVRNDGAFIVVAPTKGYTMTGEELKEIPDWLKSKLQTSQVQKNLPIKDIKISINNLDNLVKIVNEAYHQKRLDGYGVDLFLSGLAYYGIDEKEIHKIAREIFQEEYDEKRTDYMINRGIDFRNSGKLPIFFSIFREIGKDWKTRQKIKESINKEIVDELSEKLKEKFGININGVSLKGEEIRDMIINTKNFVANNELYDQSGKKIKCEIKTFGTINPEKYYKVKIINKPVWIKVEQNNEQDSKKERPKLEKKNITHYIVAVDEELNTFIFKAIIPNSYYEMNEDIDIFSNQEIPIVTDNYFIYEKFGGIFVVDPAQLKYNYDYPLNVHIEEIPRLIENHKNLEYIIAISTTYVYDDYEKFKKSFEEPRAVYARSFKREILSYVKRAEEFRGAILPPCVIKAIENIEQAIKEPEYINSILSWLKHFPGLLERNARFFQFLIGKKKIVDKNISTNPIMIDRLFPCSAFKKFCPKSGWQECSYAVPGDIYNVSVEIVDVFNKTALLKVDIVGEGEVRGEVKLGDTLPKMLRDIGAIVDEEVLSVNKKNVRKMFYKEFLKPKVKVNDFPEEELYSTFIFALINLVKESYPTVTKDGKFKIPINPLMRQMEYYLFTKPDNKKKIYLDTFADFLKKVGKVKEEEFWNGRRRKEKGYLEIKFSDLVKIVHEYLQNRDEKEKIRIINIFEKYMNNFDIRNKITETREIIKEDLKEIKGIPDPIEDKRTKEKYGLQVDPAEIHRKAEEIAEYREVDPDELQTFKELKEKYEEPIPELIFVAGLSDNIAIELEIPEQFRKEIERLIKEGVIDPADIVKLRDEYKKRFSSGMILDISEEDTVKEIERILQIDLSDIVSLDNLSYNSEDDLEDYEDFNF